MLTPRKLLWAFITEQSEGEWDEDTIRADIERFMEMLEKERLALVPASRLAKLENALEEIERKGHREGYHGRGYSLADIAEAALRESE